MSDQIKEILDIPRDFFKDGAFFLNRCTKPSKRGDSLVLTMSDVFVEFLEISRAVAVGFLVMGFIGFAVKLVHIPINNILVGCVWIMGLTVGWKELVKRYALREIAPGVRRRQETGSLKCTLLYVN